MRKLLAALAAGALFLLAPSAHAALAIDSQEASNVGHNSTTSPLSWTFTNSAGTFMLVGVVIDRNSAGTAATVSATYNGVSMTQVGTTLTINSDGDLLLFKLASPATGAHTVSVTASAGTVINDIIGGAITFTGADGTTPLGSLVTNNGSGTSATVSVTGTTSGNNVVSLVATGSGVTSATSPNVLSWKLNVNGNDASNNAALGQDPSSGGTVTPTYVLTSDVWGEIGVEVKAAAGGGGGGTPHPMLTLVDAGSVAGPPAASNRQWLFIDNVGSATSAWTSLNGISWGEPVDGLHGQTDFNDSFWFGDGFSWSPTPSKLMMSFQWGPTTGNSCIDMGAAAAGSLDSTFASFLSGHTGSAPKITRIWQEINGNWFGWSVNCTGATSVDGTVNGAAWPVSTIVGAFQHAVNKVRAAFPSTLIEWNQNCGGPWTGPNGPSQPGNSGYPFDLYPGDSFVDIVGIDCYEKNTSFTSFQSGSGLNLNNLATFAAAHGKKVGISETAAHACDGTWLTNIANWLDSEGTAAAEFSYYDQGLANNGDNILYATTGTDSCAAGTLQAALKASSFGQKAYGGPIH